MSLRDLEVVEEIDTAEVSLAAGYTACCLLGLVEPLPIVGSRNSYPRI